MRTPLGTILVAAVALFAGVATSAVAETVDLAEIEGDTLEVATLSNGIDYTNSSGSTKTLALNLSGDVTYSGTISGRIKVEATMESKDKTLTLTGANSFTGGLEIKTGTLRVTTPGSLGVGAITLATSSKSVLKFGGSMTVSNPIFLNDYSSADYAATLIVGSSCQVVLSGLVTSNRSWIQPYSDATLSLAGGIDIASYQLFCQPEGVVSFAQTPIVVPDKKLLKVSGTQSFSVDRRVSIDVSGNSVSQIEFLNRGCLRIGVDEVFSNKPKLNIPHDNRGYGRNGGGVDLYGHNTDFGNVSFVHGVVQNSFLVCNTATTTAAFSFEQTSDETAAFIETQGPLDFVKRGAALFTVTNATFAVSGRIEVEAGTLKFTGVDGVRLAETICVRQGAILDLGGHNVSCGRFLNMGGVVQNGTLAAATNVVSAPAGTTLSFSDGDLAVYYPFDNADRLCVDQSFHGNADLLLRGSPECVVDAKFGMALSLDGSSALTNSVFPATLPTGNHAWSTCIFLRYGSFSSGKYHPIGWGGCNPAKANFLQLVANNSFEHIIWSDTALRGTLSSGNFGDGWHSVVVTCSTSSGYVRSIYFDGVLVASGQINRDGNPRTPAVSAEDFAIGGRHNNERDWDGWLDEAAVFRRALTAAEVADYHAGGVSAIAAKLFDQLDGIVSQKGATLRIAQSVTTATLSGPGIVETWGLSVRESVSDCPTVIGDLTLSEGVEVVASSLPDSDALPLLRVIGGELECKGELKLVVDGVYDPDRYRVFVKDGVVYGRRSKGLCVIVR